MDLPSFRSLSGDSSPALAGNPEIRANVVVTNPNGPWSEDGTPNLQWPTEAHIVVAGQRSVVPPPPDAPGLAATQTFTTSMLAQYVGNYYSYSLGESILNSESGMRIGGDSTYEGGTWNLAALSTLPGALPSTFSRSVTSTLDIACGTNVTLVSGGDFEVWWKVPEFFPPSWKLFQFAPTRRSSDRTVSYSGCGDEGGDNARPAALGGGGSDGGMTISFVTVTVVEICYGYHIYENGVYQGSVQTHCTTNIYTNMS
jgi:hypothetical protein